MCASRFSARTDLRKALFSRFFCKTPAPGPGPEQIFYRIVTWLARFRRLFAQSSAHVSFDSQR